MTRSHQSLYWIALLAFALMRAVSQEAYATPFQAQGLVVVSDGSTNQSYAPVYEYTSLRFGGGSFGLTLVGGKKVAGLKGHVVAHFEYGSRPSVSAVAAMEALTRDHTKTVPYLAPRILWMKEVVRQMEFEAGIASQPLRRPSTILAAEMTFKGQTLRNIRATALQDGKLRFMHDEGAFALAAGELSESFLAKVGRSSPDIAASKDFRDLMATFINPVTIVGESHSGARIIGREGKKLTIETRQGLRFVDSSAIDPADLVKLEAAHQRFAKLLSEFKAEQEREAENLAEYVVHFEREELDRYRREHEAIAESQGIITVEEKILEEFERQRGHPAKGGSDAEAELLLEMRKVFDEAKSSGSSFPAPAARETE